MRVRVGAVQGGRSIDLELSDEDVPELASLPLPQRFRALSAKADQLVVYYLSSENLISPELARSRMAALSEVLRG